LNNSKSVRKFVRKNFSQNVTAMATNYYLDNRPDKAGRNPIRISITIAGARLVTSTGLKIAPDKWDSTKQMARRGATASHEINTALARITQHFAELENSIITSGQPLTKADLKTELAKAVTTRQSRAAGSTPAKVTFWDYFNQFTQERGKQNAWTKGTHQRFSVLRNHLFAYNSRLTFASLTESGLIGFVDYLRDTAGMRNSTILKNVSFLRWFLRWATAKGYNRNLAFETFAPKLKQATKVVVFLDWQELMNVYNLAIPSNGTLVTLQTASGDEYTKRVTDSAGMAKAREIFCFCAFTGLRYSDAANLKRSDVMGDYITITTIKTGDTLKIELNKWAKSILDRNATDTTSAKVLPQLSNQRMNEYLKLLFELAGINQPITQTYYRGNERITDTRPKFAFCGTHTARRTFICNALMLGIPPQVVMKWTGHSDYKAMKPYIDVTDAAKAAQMDKFNAL